MNNPTESRPRISKIWAKNFRSIENFEMHLNPLTVLVGPNASGKSNIVDVLRFVSDAIRNGLDSALTTRRGDQVARRSQRRPKATDITLGFRIEQNLEYSVEYEFTIRIYVGGEYKVRQEKARVEVDGAHLEVFDIEIRNGRLIKPAIKLPISILSNSFDEIKKHLETNLQRGTSIELPFLGVFSLMVISGKTLYLENISEVMEALTKTANLLRDLRFYHISPDALREPQKIASKYPLEEHGENLASVLEDMMRKPNQFMPELLNAFSQVVPGVNDVSVTRAGGHLVVKLRHSGRKSAADDIWLDASQESDGTLRTLGLLVALYQDPTPPFIAIEEPELTIHPGALSVLAELIQEATQRTSLLITTHSPELLDLLPIECIRSVEAIDDATEVGNVADHQRNAVMKGLFSPGELHRMEGLQLAAKED